MSSLFGGFLAWTRATRDLSVPQAVASNCNLYVFTFAELRDATGAFAAGNKIGQGGFGKVYRGIIEDGVRAGLRAQVVAVKQALVNDDNVDELLKEAMFLAQLQVRHPSLVKMIGYCWEGQRRLLVYEYMDHGSLDHYLSKPVRSTLLWSTRLNIAITTAKVLASLHGAENPLLCGEFTSSDILLDSDNNAKIMLSGLRLDTRATDDTFVTSRVGRTQHGWAPEYIRPGRLTAKSDVYSFGMVLLEILITGLKEQYLVVYARPCLKDPRRLARIMDRELQGIYPVAAAREAALLASKCIEVKPENRPEMSEVMEALELLTNFSVTEL